MKRFISFRLSVMTLLLWMLFPSLASAYAQDLDQNWEYRWGDSAFQGDQPLLLQSTDDAEWHAIDFPSNPPDRNGHTNVWYRTTLPEGHWHNAILYIYSVDLIVQVYLDNEKIYQYGQFDTKGRGHFEGWPWHMIPLPENAGGKPVYFRVFSDYMDIGLWGEVKLMDKMDFYQMIWQRSADGLLITGFTLIIALLSLLFAVHSAQRPVFLPLALFALSAAGLALSDTQAKQLILHGPLFWDYLEAISYYLMPVALMLLLTRSFGLLSGGFANTVTFVFSSYLPVALLLSLTGLVSLSDTYPVFDFLFAVLVPVTLVLAFRHGPLNPDQKVILSATALLTLLLLLDMAVAHSWIDWNQIPVGWGTLSFAMALVVLALRHYLQTQNALAELNASLESRVAARTHELELLARHEAERAEALAYIHRRNEDFSNMITRLEQEKEVSAAVPLLLRCLPDILETVPGVIYTVSDTGLRRTCYWPLQGEMSLPETLPACSESDIKPPPGWVDYILQYDHPEYDKQRVALLWLDMNTLEQRMPDLEPLALKTLLDRATERVNLTLSKISLQSALRRFSYEDGLTGLKNRRYLDDRLPELLALRPSQRGDLVLMICDIDHFKQVNDTYGHAAGDEVLRRIAVILKRVFRQSDLLCRFGGEEFVIVLHDASLSESEAKAEQLREMMAQTALHFDNRPLEPITLSVGVCHAGETCTPDQLLRCADSALYQAKTSGRNRVVCYREA